MKFKIDHLSVLTLAATQVLGHYTPHLEVEHGRDFVTIWSRRSLASRAQPLAAIRHKM